MSSRRVPLSSNPNAANSPYRSMAAAASKQKRSHATIQREESYGQPPPAKKQMLDTHQTLRTPPHQESTQSSAEGRVFTRKSNSSQQSVFERKLVAARERERERQSQQTVTKAERTSEENLESIRAWQKHMKRSFPKFVFYFESGPEDSRQKCTKQVIALGAVSLMVLNSNLCCNADAVLARGEVLLECRHTCHNYQNYTSRTRQHSSRGCYFLHK